MFIRECSTRPVTLSEETLRFKFLMTKYLICFFSLTVCLIICYESACTCGRVLNAELYAQRLQKLIYLHLSTACFIKISL